MTLHLKLKTTRTRTGYARAKVSRYMNYSYGRFRYSFTFYNDFEVFDSHHELRSYILERYDCDIGTRQDFWGL